MTCSRCGGQGVLLSRHGRLTWYMCQKCWVAYSNAPPANAPHPPQSATVADLARRFGDDKVENPNVQPAD